MLPRAFDLCYVWILNTSDPKRFVVPKTHQNGNKQKKHLKKRDQRGTCAHWCVQCFGQLPSFLVIKMKWWVVLSFIFCSNIAQSLPGKTSSQLTDIFGKALSHQLGKHFQNPEVDRSIYSNLPLMVLWIFPLGDVSNVYSLTKSP